MSDTTDRPNHAAEGQRGSPSAGTFDRFSAEAVVDLARRAPSIHNTQPWHWRLVDDVLELRADRHRQLAVADPDGHSLIVSCGAALALTALACRATGWAVDIERLPDRADTDLLARFTNPTPRQLTPDDIDRSAAAQRRFSNRDPYARSDVPASLIEQLRNAADAAGVHTHFPLRDEERLNLAVAVSWADRIEREDPAYLAEMARWVRDPDVSTDGVPTSAVPHINTASPRHTDIPLRDFEVGLPGHRLVQTDADERPLIGVVMTESDLPSEQLAAGEAMMRLMIEAELAGVASCPLSQAVDLGAFRSRLQTLMGWQGYPQMMLRFGFPVADRTPAPRTPRRAVVDVLQITNRPA